MEETKNVWISDQAAEVLEYLKTTHYEESIAVKSGAICELFNLKKESLRAVVNCLRSDGYPVCSSCRGYWYSEKPEDIDKTLKHLGGENLRDAEGYHRIKKDQIRRINRRDRSL